VEANYLGQNFTEAVASVASTVATALHSVTWQSECSPPDLPEISALKLPGRDGGWLDLYGWWTVYLSADPSNAGL